MSDHMHTTDCTCRDVADTLAAFLDGELSPTVKAALERHVAECPDCVRYMRSYRRTIDLASAAFGAADAAADADPSCGLPPRLVEAIRKALHEAQ